MQEAHKVLDAQRCGQCVEQDPPERSPVHLDPHKATLAAMQPVVESEINEAVVTTRQTQKRSISANGKEHVINTYFCVGPGGRGFQQHSLVALTQ